MANIFYPADYLELHPSFLVNQIQFALDQIAQANERIHIANQQILRDRATISQFEDLIANHRLLLEVGIHSGHKGGVAELPTTGATRDEAGPSGTRKDDV